MPITTSTSTPPSVPPPTNINEAPPSDPNPSPPSSSSTDTPKNATHTSTSNPPSIQSSAFSISRLSLTSAPNSRPSSASDSVDLSKPPDSTMELSDPPPLILSNKHLKPGHRASILDFTVTLDLYRENASKTNDPGTQLEFVRFLLLAAPQFPDQTQRLRKEAIKLAKKVAQQSEEGRCVLAECLELGYAHKQGQPNYAKAFQMYLQAAKKQHPEAAYRVGVYYEQGRGVVKSSPRAVQFYQKAAAAGHPGAMYRLGMAELHGELGLPVNPRNAVKWLKHSASGATPDHPLALYELAQLHETGIEHIVFVDNDYAVKLYMEAAQMGHIASMYRLASYYEHGKHVPKDMKVSFDYYRAAAENGHAEAMFGLATWYLTGNEEANVNQCDTMAFDWMHKCASLGFEKAMFAIGHFYEEGIGVPKDLRLATTWYEKAPKYPDLPVPLNQDSHLIESYKKGDKENCLIM